MGNLMCCCNEKLQVKNSTRNGGDGSDTVIDHTQQQRQHNKENALTNGESSVKATKMSSPKKILPIENVNPIQVLNHTTSGRIAKPAVDKRIKVLHSKPSLNNLQQVFRKVLKSHQCNACGDLDHLTEGCRYRTRLCFYCREEGHILRICPKLKRTKKGNGMHCNGTSQVPPIQKGKLKLNHVKQKRNKVVKS